MHRILRYGCALIAILFSYASFAAQQERRSAYHVSELISVIQSKAHSLESSSGMIQAYQTFKKSYGLSTVDVSYSDFVIVRLLFEATRDAGFWNLPWTITNREPNSDFIWKQWRVASRVTPTAPTAIGSLHELCRERLSVICALDGGRASRRNRGRS